MTDTLLRIEQVEAITTLSKRTIYRLMGQGFWICRLPARLWKGRDYD